VSFAKVFAGSVTIEETKSRACLSVVKMNGAGQGSGRIETGLRSCFAGTFRFIDTLPFLASAIAQAIEDVFSNRRSLIDVLEMF
jgi:hypothetical protein